MGMTLSPPYDTGVIHGRFQVPHNDHVKYLLAGKELCRHLVIGITNPEPVADTEDPADRQRNLPVSNPLTYFERYRLLKEVLAAKNVPPETVSIVPMPILEPERYRYFLPLDAVFFLTIYDDWGRKKLRTFQKLGLTTQVLWEVSPEQKGISASDVRQRMINKQTWHHLVPPVVAQRLEEWHIPARLRRMAGQAR